MFSTRWFALLCLALVTACGSATAPAYPPPNDLALEDTPLWEKIGGEAEDDIEEEEDDDWVDPGGDDEDDELEAAPEPEPAAGKK